MRCTAGHVIRADVLCAGRIEGSQGDGEEPGPTRRGQAASTRDKAQQFATNIQAA